MSGPVPLTPAINERRNRSSQQLAERVAFAGLKRAVLTDPFQAARRRPHLESLEMQAEQAWRFTRGAPRAIQAWPWHGLPDLSEHRVRGDVGGLRALERRRLALAGPPSDRL